MRLGSESVKVMIYNDDFFFISSRFQFNIDEKINMIETLKIESNSFKNILIEK